MPKPFYRGLMIAILTLFGSNGVVFAGPFEDASAAYNRGDYDIALRIWRPLAQQGNEYAQYDLGLIYEKLSDHEEAIKWYRLAAEQGNADAQTKLGEAYAKGWGVREDDMVSYMWLSVGDTYLANSILIPYVAGKMAPAQIALAQKMAKQCKESYYKQCGEPKTDQFGASATSVPMQLEGGTYVVPVQINDAITLDFVVDSGAADVSIPADVVMTLMRTKTLKQSDFLGEKTYVLADGSKVPSQTFRIRSLKIGNKVLENVNGSIAPVQGSLLLGQSFLSRFKSWSVDNGKHALLLSEWTAMKATILWILLTTLDPNTDGHIVHNTHANGLFPTKEVCERAGELVLREIKKDGFARATYECQTDESEGYSAQTDATDIINSNLKVSSTGIYRGVFQYGPEQPFYNQILKATPAQQILWYKDWWEYYNIQQKLAHAGIVPSKLTPAGQAALLMGIQFAPNNTAWLDAVAQGRWDERATTKPQAAHLGDTSFQAMLNYFNTQMRNDPPSMLPVRYLTDEMLRQISNAPTDLLTPDETLHMRTGRKEATKCAYFRRRCAADGISRQNSSPTGSGF